MARAAKAEEAAFRPGLLRFLRALAENNEREWFLANKPTYEKEVRGPALEFIGRMSVGLESLAPHVVADPRPNGGSLLRQHRDIRFSKDKSPYKRHVGIGFRHEAAKMSSAPGFYLHLEPGACFFGAGIWRPDREALLAIRKRITDEPKAWSQAVKGASFRKRFTLAGESLQRPPRGADPEHPWIDDLRRKDFIATAEFTHKQVQGPGFDGLFLEMCKGASGLNRFLAGSLGLPF